MSKPTGAGAAPKGNPQGAEQNGLSLVLSPALVDVLAERVAALLADRHAPAEPDGWLDVEQAAAYLSCQPKRIYDLRSQGRLRYAKDGSRLLFRRLWLDDVLEEAA